MTAEPNWYDDPWDQNSLRYFDGTQWTSHVSAKALPAHAQPVHYSELSGYDEYMKSMKLRFVVCGILGVISLVINLVFGNFGIIIVGILLGSIAAIWMIPVILKMIKFMRQGYSKKDAESLAMKSPSSWFCIIGLIFFMLIGALPLMYFGVSRIPIAAMFVLYGGLFAIGIIPVIWIVLAIEKFSHS